MFQRKNVKKKISQYSYIWIFLYKRNVKYNLDRTRKFFLIRSFIYSPKIIRLNIKFYRTFRLIEQCIIETKLKFFDHLSPQK